MEIPIRNWRLLAADDVNGYFLYFDASSERVTLRELTRDEKIAYLDKPSSVSAPSRVDQAKDSDGCVGPEISSQGLLPF